MIAAEFPDIPEKMGKIAKAVNGDGPRILALIGEDVEGALKQSITELVDPPLAPSTIQRKGFDKPLVETGHMLQSTGYEVKT